jgi:hypothetical protein
MTHRDENIKILLRRLEMLTSRCVILKLQTKETAAALADAGCIINSFPPDKNSNDSAEITEMKNKISYLYMEEQNYLHQIAKLGAIVLDEETMEILLPGGPGEGSFLSWVPAEPGISHWRKTASSKGARLYFGHNHHESADPVLH